MSTRCHLEVKENGSSTYIYHHHDGYPSGVGSDVKKALKEVRFFDKEKELTKQQVIETICEIDGGYEIDNGFHGDEEYYYVIDCENRTLKCYGVPWDLEDTDEIFKECNLKEIPND